MKKNSRQKGKIINFLFLIVLGLFMGWVSADLEGVKTADEIAGGLGIWIFVISLAGIFSQSSTESFLRGALFILSSVTGFYGNRSITGTGKMFTDISAFLIVILIGGMLGFIAYHFKEKGWSGALCISVPLSLFLAEGYEIYSDSGFSVPLAVNLCGALILVICFARGKHKKIKVLPLVIAFTFVLIYFDIIRKFFGGWI